MKDFASVAHPPKSVAGLSQLGQFANPESRRIMSEFVSRLTQSQQDFLITELGRDLDLVPSMARGAKHKSIVSLADMTRLRTLLLGNQIQPGLLVKLVQVFPTLSNL